jgi:hypothetical protein
VRRSCFARFGLYRLDLGTAADYELMLRFMYMLLLRRGFLDGRAGWTYCRLLATYEYWIVLKARQLRGG